MLEFLTIHQKVSAQVKSIESEDSTRSTVEKIKHFSRKDNFISRLLKNIIEQDDDQQAAVPSPPDPDTEIISKYTGKIIRNVNVKVLDVFGGSVDKPEDTLRSWLQERGNSLHMNSREWLIKNSLIFSRGDVFSPYVIKESERILRQNNYIYDVRIIPRRIKSNPDSIDVMVYIQDLWTINGSVSYSPGNKNGRVSFNDLNFLGYGNEIMGGIKFDRELSNGWDWDGSYSISNIQRTFLSASVFYLSDKNLQRYGVMAGRDFFSPVIRWAGGIAQSWQNTRNPDLKNVHGSIETIRLNMQDYWLGYAFGLKPFDPKVIHQNRFNIAGRITRTVYSQKPDFDTLNLFQDNTFYLGRIGYSYLTYLQDRFIFGLGRTEDIPLINMVEFLFGTYKGANSSRPYYGLKTGYSFYSDNLGYLYGGFQTGAFRSDDKWLNRTSVLELLYFSKLNAIGSYKWRHYIGSRYSYSYDPARPDNILNINNEGGLRGFSDGELKGNKKLVLNYENDIFVPLKFFGFKLAIITFADFGLISPSEDLLFSSKLYQGYGIGFRLKNEHLVFPPFQFMFGFYPNSSKAGGEHFSMFHQSSIYYRFNRFRFSTPSVISTE